MKRSEFIKKMIAGGVVLSLPIPILPAGKTGHRRNVSFGVCADVHKDIMHDADSRLKQFVDEATQVDADFIIQLGDFCCPYERNQSFMDIWNSFGGNIHHVLGNHDMDGGFSREETLKYWNSKAKYYSFDEGGIHFVVLDGNDVNPSPDKASGYARYIGKEQLAWLEKDLNATTHPVVLFSHQSIENNGGVENADEVQRVLEAENKRVGYAKVIACFNGHHHTDNYVQKNGIYYVHINSMSYSWVGGEYKTVRYSKEIDEKHPWIKYTIPYKEPIFAFIQIKNNKIEIIGTKTEFVGIGPEELGIPPKETEPIVPFISDVKLKI